MHRRVHSGAYRAQPSRRRFIPKPDGRLRPLGIAALEDKIMAATPCPGAGHPRALRRRRCRRLRAQGRRRAVLGGYERAYGAVRADGASRQDASHRVRPLRCGEPKAARRGQTGDIRLPRIHAYLRAHPTRRLFASAKIVARPDARQAALQFSQLDYDVCSSVQTAGADPSETRAQRAWDASQARYATKLCFRFLPFLTANPDISRGSTRYSVRNFFWGSLRTDSPVMAGKRRLARP